MQALLTITAPVFLIIGLGVFCTRMSFFKGEAQKIFSLYVFYCSMPCYLFLAMTKVPRDMIVRTDYIAAFGLSMAVIAFLAFLICKRFHKLDFGNCLMAAMGACYTNSAFIGIPIIVMAFGQPSFVVIVTMFQVIVVTTIILTGMEIYQRHGLFSFAALREFPQTVLLNPIVGSSFLGILFAFQSWPVPQVAERALQLLGGTGIPTALFALGLSLGEKRPAMPKNTKGLVYALVGLKIFVHPALAWLIGHYIFALPYEWLAPLTIVAAMPTAMNNFVFAQRYGVFTVESGQTVFLSSVLALPTLSALLWAFGVGQ